MIEKSLLLAIAGLVFVTAWRAESGMRLVLTPFLLAMYFELARVLPAFAVAEYYIDLPDSYALSVAVTGFIALVAGFVFFYCLPGSDPSRVLSLSAGQRDFQETPIDTMAGLAVAALLAGGGLLYFGGLPATVSSALSLITSGGNEDLARLVAQQRLELTKGAYFGGEYRGQGIFKSVQQIGWSIVCTFAVLLHLSQRRYRTMLFLIASVVMAWLLVGGMGSRAPLLNILICMLAAYSIRHPLSVKTAGIAVAAALLIAIALGLYSTKMFSLFTGSTSAGQFIPQALMEITERALIGNGINDVRAIEFSRAGILDYEFGSNHARDLLAAMPGVQRDQPLAYTLYLLVERGRGTTYLTPTYLADVYVDFGWAGVVFIFFAIGALVAATQRWLFSLSPRPWSVAVAIVAAFYVMNILMGGIISFVTFLFVLTLLLVVHFALRCVLSLLPLTVNAEANSLAPDGDPGFDEISRLPPNHPSTR